MNSLNVAIALAFFGAIISAVLLLITMADRQSLAKRLESSASGTLGQLKIKKLPKKSSFGKLDKRFKQAGISADAKQILTRYFILQLIFFLIFSMLFNIGAGLVSLAVVHAISLWILKKKYQKRQKRFEAQLCDAIQVISNAMKSGYSFFQALSRVVEDSPDPLGTSFGQVVKEMSLGKPMESAFEQLLDNYPIEDLQLMVSAIFIQKEIGGNLADILDTMLETLRERQRIAAEVSALTAQGKLSGWIVSVLPFGIGVFLFVVNPSYISLLFTTPVGRIMLVGALFNEFLGIMLIKGIIKVEY